MPAKLKGKPDRFAFVEKVPPAEVGYATEKVGAARLMSILQANPKKWLAKKRLDRNQLWRIGGGRCV